MEDRKELTSEELLKPVGGEGTTLKYAVICYKCRKILNRGLELKRAKALMDEYTVKGCPECHELGSTSLIRED